jgi:hypothetical protein
MLLRLITLAAIRAPSAMAQEISTSRISTSRALKNPVTTNRVITAAAMSARGSRARARIAPKVIARKAIGRFVSGQGLIVRAKGEAPGRSIRAAMRNLLIEMPIGRAATTKTTARSL